MQKSGIIKNAIITVIPQEEQHLYSTAWVESDAFEGASVDRRKVLMIERCKGSTRSLLRSKGFVRSRYAEPEKCHGVKQADCPRDQVWYHPDRIRPSREDPIE